MNYFKHCYETGSDFYEMGSGNLFHVSDYLRVKNLGLPSLVGGIVVTDAFGEEVGILPEEEIEKLLKSRD